MKVNRLVAKAMSDSRQRVEHEAPWEPRSFTEDNAFHLGWKPSRASRYGRGGGVGRGLGVR